MEENNALFEISDRSIMLSFMKTAYKLIILTHWKIYTDYSVAYIYHKMPWNYHAMYKFFTSIERRWSIKQMLGIFHGLW